MTCLFLSSLTDNVETDYKRQQEDWGAVTGSTLWYVHNCLFLLIVTLNLLCVGFMGERALAVAGAATNVRVPFGRYSSKYRRVIITKARACKKWRCDITISLLYSVAPTNKRFLLFDRDVGWKFSSVIFCQITCLLLLLLLLRFLPCAISSPNPCSPGGSRLPVRLCLGTIRPARTLRTARLVSVTFRVFWALHLPKNRPVWVLSQSFSCNVIRRRYGSERSVVYGNPPDISV